MARPLKYNWGAIQEAYEGGLPIHDISKKFKVPVNKINEKAKIKQWDKKDNLKADIEGFKTSFKTITDEDNIKHKEVKEILTDEIIQTIKQNELIKENMELIMNTSKFFLGRAVKAAKNGDANMDDFYKGIKIATEAGMNLGVIPRHQSSSVNIQNNLQNNLEQTGITVKFDGDD